MNRNIWCLHWSWLVRLRTSDCVFGQLTLGSAFVYLFYLSCLNPKLWFDVKAQIYEEIKWNVLFCLFVFVVLLDIYSQVQSDKYLWLNCILQHELFVWPLDSMKVNKPYFLNICSSDGVFVVSVLERMFLVMKEYNQTKTWMLVWTDG